MGKLWDIYDKDRKLTGKKIERGVDLLKDGEYHIVVTGIIMNSKNEILISKRAAYKEFGLKWECSGGSIITGETSLQGVLRELKEELGLFFQEKDAILLKEIRRDRIPPNFKDMWLFRKDVDLKELTFPDGEVIDAKWVTIDEFMEMFKHNEIIPNVDFGREDYEKAIEMK